MDRFLLAVEQGEWVLSTDARRIESELKTLGNMECAEEVLAAPVKQFKYPVVKSTKKFRLFGRSFWLSWLKVVDYEDVEKQEARWNLNYSK